MISFKISMFWQLWHFLKNSRTTAIAVIFENDPEINFQWTAVRQRINIIWLKCIKIGRIKILSNFRLNVLR